MPGGKAPRQKGDNFERRVKKHLESLGYWCRRAGRSAFPDLVALKYHKGYIAVYFIEVKMNKYISKEERAELIRLRETFGIVPLIAYKKDRVIRFCDIKYKEYGF